MTDLFDQASMREEQDRELCIGMARRAAESVPATGRCHWCDASVPPGYKFCDSDCRDDWERDRKIRERR